MGKAANLAVIAAAQVLALALWFAGTAAGPICCVKSRPWARRFRRC